MLRTQITFFAATVAITGCRPTQVPGTVLQPVVTAPTSDASLESGGPWVLTPSRQPHRYHSISQTTVHELSESAPRQSSIEVTTVFTISLNQSQTSLIISGHIDTVRFNPENQIPSKNYSVTLPLLFEGELASTALTIKVKNPQLLDGSCNPFISSILSDLHTAVAIYPTRLTPGFRWRDSTLITACTEGGIPTTRKTIQSFKVVGERTFNTTRAVLLQRSDSTYISGDGAENNHQIHLEGIGTGTANIYISPGVALTLAVELSEKTEFAITNSGKTKRFVQEITQRLNTTD